MTKIRDIMPEHREKAGKETAGKRPHMEGWKGSLLYMGQEEEHSSLLWLVQSAKRKAQRGVTIWHPW